MGNWQTLLIRTVQQSTRKVKAGLKYAASGEYQDYPPGTLELGIVLDAIDMISMDILDFCHNWNVLHIFDNIPKSFTSEEVDQVLRDAGYDPHEVAKRMANTATRELLKMAHTVEQQSA